MELRLRRRVQRPMLRPAPMMLQPWKPPVVDGDPRSAWIINAAKEKAGHCPAFLMRRVPAVSARRQSPHRPGRQHRPARFAVRALPGGVQRLLVGLGGGGVERHQHDPHRLRVAALPGQCFGHCDLRRLVQRIAIDTAADRRERDRLHAQRLGQLQRLPVAVGKQRRFVALAVMPDRADRVQYMARRQRMGTGGAHFARRATHARRNSGNCAHSSSNAGPAARWIAPSTPPPPSSVSLAALTIASTARVVMSPCQTSIFMRPSPACEVIRAAAAPAVPTVGDRASMLRHDRLTRCDPTAFTHDGGRRLHAG